MLTRPILCVVAAVCCAACPDSITLTNDVMHPADGGDLNPVIDTTGDVGLDSPLADTTPDVADADPTQEPPIWPIIVRSRNAGCADGIAHGVDEEGHLTQSGPTEFAGFHALLITGFAERRFEVHDVISEDDRCAIRWLAKMTHTGPFMGNEPTGREVSITGMSCCKMRDGKIHEGWNNWDIGLLVSQTAAAPSPRSS